MRDEYLCLSYRMESEVRSICEKALCFGISGRLRELNFGGPKFDVVGFSPDKEEFYIIECKCTKRAVGVGQTFGQILAYKAMILEAGDKFINAFNEKLVRNRIKKVGFWANTARFVDQGKIPVRFYVALMDEACRPETLELIKKDLSGVGIIRFDKHDHCKDYIRRSGEPDYELCESSRVLIPIAIPPRPYLKRVLEAKNSSTTVVTLAAKLDAKIRKLKDTSAVSRGEPPYAIAYRAAKNFTLIYPREEHLLVAIKENSNWKNKNISKTSQVTRIFPKIKAAFGRSQNA